MRLDHRQGMGHDGDNGILVEALEVLPRCLAPIDDGVQTWRPIIERCKVAWENFKSFNRNAIVTAITHALAVVRSHYPAVDL